MTAVEDFIYQYEGNQRELLLYFHHLLTTDLNLEDKIRFKIPFYYGRSWICYLNPTKDGKIEFAFVRGNELSNSQGILDSKGRKQVYGVEIYDTKDINEELILEVMHEAILLDETTPYESKNKKRL